MPLPTWDQLEKNQEDNETIEEAIARLIAAHNDAAEAHIGAGRSLNSHKASATIDHLANSIVTDKIKDEEITDEKCHGMLLGDKQSVYTAFESFDGWYIDGNGSAGAGVGEGKLHSGANLNDYVRARVYATISGPDFSAKNPYFQTQLKVAQSTNIKFFFGLGYIFWASYDTIGFRIEDGDLYARYYGNSQLTEEQITGIDTTILHKYKVVLTSGSKIEFWVDDVLKVTKTTDLPVGTHQRSLSLHLETKENASKHAEICWALFGQDL